MTRAEDAFNLIFYGRSYGLDFAVNVGVAFTTDALEHLIHGWHGDPHGITVSNGIERIQTTGQTGTLFFRCWDDCVEYGLCMGMPCLGSSLGGSFYVFTGGSQARAGQHEACG